MCPIDGVVCCVADVSLRRNAHIRVARRVHACERWRYGVGATAARCEAYKVRLQGIDAPEICQPWGPQARAALHAVLQGQVVEVQGHARDSYGRLLAQLSRQGQDVGVWMVGQGYAWS